MLKTSCIGRDFVLRWVGLSLAFRPRHEERPVNSAVPSHPDASPDGSTPKIVDHVSLRLKKAVLTPNISLSGTARRSRKTGLDKEQRFEPESIVSSE